MRAVEQAMQKTAASAPPATQAGKRASPKPRMMADPRNEFSDDEWQDMVATAAYYRAEARGFDGGSADEDWYEAEAEMRERFAVPSSHIETISAHGGDAADIETRGE